MGKIIFLYIILLFFITGCKVVSTVAIKNAGVIMQDNYINKNYSFSFNANSTQKIEIDSIRLDSLDIPIKLKEEILSKSSKELFVSGISKSNTSETFLFVYSPKTNNLEKFTDLTLKRIFKVGAENIRIKKSFRILDDSIFKKALFYSSSDFIKYSTINIISYGVKEKKNYFELNEYHIPTWDKKNVIRVITCVNKYKVLKKFETTELFEQNLVLNSIGVISKIDTGINVRKIDFSNVSSLFSLGDSLINVNGVKAAFDSIKLMKSYYTENTDFQSKSFYYQTLMLLASFAEDNLLSLEAEINAFPRPTRALISIENTSKAIDAVDYILDKFCDKPIIMINEAHNRGQNRYFGRKLLPSLFKKGFRYLAVEGLNFTKDSLINKRGFPTINSGYFIKESAYGQFLRDAIGIGFKVIAYEDTTYHDPKASFMDVVNSREEEQTKNIKSILEKDLTAKILVYAGHDHIHKKSSDNWIKMGERLGKSLNINVPSLECTWMSECFQKNKEHSIYRAFIDSFKINEPSVLINNDTAYVDPLFKGKVDVNIFMPRTNYDLGYPDWLKETADIYFTLKIPNNCEEAYLQVYKANEWNQVRKEAIPVMQFTVQKNRPEYKLYLRRGEYKIFISKNNRNIVDDYFTVN